MTAVSRATVSRLLSSLRGYARLFFYLDTRGKIALIAYLLTATTGMRKRLYRPTRTVDIKAEDIRLTIRLFSGDIAAVREVLMERVYGLLGEPHGTVLDAGGHIGCFSLWASRSASVIHVFEPDPANYALLKRNIEANERANIFPHKVGLWSGKGLRRFFSSSGGIYTGVSSFLVETGPASEVETTSIDEFCRQHCPGPIDMLKIDVEGAEREVLRGATDTLKRYRPAIVAELHSDDLEREVVTLLRSLNYVTRLRVQGSSPRPVLFFEYERG